MPKSYWTRIQTPNGLKYFRADDVTDELLQKIKDESSNVFWAEYDVTQFDDIKAAYDAGKSIYVVKSESRNSYIYSLKNYFHYESDPTMDQFLFTCMCQSEERLITCFTSNWNTSATRHFANYSDVSALSGSVAPSYSRIPCPIPKGTYATKNNVLYKANTTITSSGTYAQWDDSQWDLVTIGGELTSLISETLLAVQQNIAPEYSTSQTYAVGDIVYRNSLLYRCTTAITLPEHWTDAHWTATSMDVELSRLIKTFTYEPEYGVIPAVWPDGESVETAIGNVRIVRILKFSRGGTSIYTYSHTNNAGNEHEFVSEDGFSKIVLHRDILDDTYSWTKETSDVPRKQSIVPRYSSESTYDVGDLVYSGESLYRCITAISTPEIWNSNHWTQTTLYDIIKDLQTRVAALEGN